eukprot:CAMPEP_0197447290 /NCGR_PEP_ID=MMETSP1175-20131217/12728_1 /TAXON_ID=1003142 /ORGANISM="Triceratium dubium, Strain CCMP147" /LENGTH=38 /DNA_ID= /DNA_START= /DNA_END= /DNA_ORIENTATION=
MRVSGAQALLVFGSIVVGWVVHGAKQDFLEAEPYFDQS